MKHEESENLTKEELFEQIKGKCKSRAKREFYIGLFWLLLIIVLLVWKAITKYPYEVKDSIFLIENAVIACLVGWLVLYSYRYKKMFERLDTPDQLLYWYDKRMRKGRIFTIVFFIVFYAAIILREYIGENLNSDSLIRLLVLLAVLVILVPILVSGGVVLGRDMKTIEQLRQLIDKE